MKLQLTPQQYAARIGIGQHAVRKQIRLGRLPENVKVIRHSRFYLLEVVEERLRGLVSHDQLKDTLLGSVGVPERDAYEAELRAEIVGPAIRKMRRKRALIQDQA